MSVSILGQITDIIQSKEHPMVCIHVLNFTSIF